MGTHIKAYEIGNRTMQTRLAWGNYYSMQSEKLPSIVYVIRPNEIGIVDTDVGVRISMSLLKDLADIYKEAQDLINRRIVK